MTATTKNQKLADFNLACDSLEHFKEAFTQNGAMLLISADYGKGTTDYFRVTVAYTNPQGVIQTAHLTWAIAKAMGYSLRNRNGAHYLAINGGGFSKSFEIASSLATLYGVDSIRYELI
jgi:hypothetical protein